VGVAPAEDPPDELRLVLCEPAPHAQASHPPCTRWPISVRDVGFYREQVLPRLVDRTCGTGGLRRWRATVTEGLAGRIVGIGFGSGLNIDFYPPDVEAVLAVEPAALARNLSEKRVSRSGVVVQHIGLDGQAIPLDDESRDGALSTFTLCTIPDAPQALAELRQVLRPGAPFHFLEHGLAPDPGVAAWQRRIEPWQRRLADGRHLTRQPDTLVREAGFTIERIEQRYAKGPKPWSWFSAGFATNPSRETDGIGPASVRRG
jgi:SAM-dependent methyltransferase